MKLNWFSSLPPARSATAQQTMELLPRLRERMEVTLWSNETSPPAGMAAKHFDPARPPWREISQADLSFYQLGNDPRSDHAAWSVSRQHPGVIILHDLALQDFFAGLVQNQRFTRHQYLELIERYHGLAGRVEGEAYLRGEINRETLAETCPMTEAAIDGALAVILHQGIPDPDLTSAVPIIRLTSHSIANYVDELLRVAGRLAEFQANWIAHHLAESAGTQMADWHGAFPDDLPLRGVAREIQVLSAGKI